MEAPRVTALPTPDGSVVHYPAVLCTVAQIEERHPALKGRVRGFILRADLASPDYAGLRDAIIRLGRSVYVDEPRLLAWLSSFRGAPPAPPRNPDGRAGSSTVAKCSNRKAAPTGPAVRKRRASQRTECAK